ncbi:MAG: hypothetical protein PF694_12070 [Bacteroidetes bacterium]|nr:hypothetical protein [Bacteroidota bacterium]
MKFIFQLILALVFMLVMFFLVGYGTAFYYQKVYTSKISQEEFQHKISDYNYIKMVEDEKQMIAKEININYAYILTTIIIVISVFFLVKYKGFKELFVLFKKSLPLKIYGIFGTPLAAYFSSVALKNPTTPMMELNISKWIIYSYYIFILAMPIIVIQVIDLKDVEFFKKLGRKGKIISILIVIVFFLAWIFKIEDTTHAIAPFGSEMIYGLVDFYKNLGML